MALQEGGGHGRSSDEAWIQLQMGEYHPSMGLHHVTLGEVVGFNRTASSACVQS